MEPDASLWVTIGIAVLALAVVGLLSVAVSRSASDGSRRGLAFALGACGWLAFTGVLAQLGLLSDFDARPPRLLLVLVPVLVMPVWLARSAIGTDLINHTSIAALVGFHAFRFPLELVMHQAALEGTMPTQMTFTGWNFDIVTGVTAIVVALLAIGGRAPRWLLISWNALGSLLLFTIVAIAVASLPLFHAFGTAPSQINTWVAYFPFVWLPAALVSSALFGHVLLWRRLLA